MWAVVCLVRIVLDCLGHTGLAVCEDLGRGYISFTEAFVINWLVIYNVSLSVQSLLLSRETARKDVQSNLIVINGLEFTFQSDIIQLIIVLLTRFASVFAPLDCIDSLLGLLGPVEE